MIWDERGGPGPTVVSPWGVEVVAGVVGIDGFLGLVCCWSVDLTGLFDREGVTGPPAAACLCSEPITWLRCLEWAEVGLGLGVVGCRNDADLCSRVADDDGVVGGASWRCDLGVSCAEDWAVTPDFRANGEELTASRGKTKLFGRKVARRPSGRASCFGRDCPSTGPLTSD